ncbi:hypothetical protein KQX54_017359 [Cotesia glomerata]|uniref:Uncharacterized protein n=1 Tax=Cotesia glomerata TaxID=32391 RepID=A0AAV7I3P6_COTGL|nr:hypothetical protein KQX54_017359 [Cotesia glomerata]
MELRRKNPSGTYICKQRKRRRTDTAVVDRESFSPCTSSYIQLLNYCHRCANTIAVAGLFGLYSHFGYLEWSKVDGIPDQRIMLDTIDHTIWSRKVYDDLLDLGANYRASKSHYIWSSRTEVYTVTITIIVSNIIYKKVQAMYVVCPYLDYYIGKPRLDNLKSIEKGFRLY